jgi:energy-coupling factor transport system ATP-binding protein
VGDDLIELKQVSFSYDRDRPPVIRDLNLTVNKGELVVITGKSGCGKTTVTRVINGLATHFYNGDLDGRVVIDGKDQRDIPFWNIGKRIGAVLQDPSSQFFADQAIDEIAFGCENYGLERHVMQRRIVHAAEKTGSTVLLDQRLHDLSSGQQQRLAIASIYAISPDIYVFDEPSANLDSDAVEQLRQLLETLKKEGKTVLIAEHRLFYLTEIADRILYMENGALTKTFSPTELSGLNNGDLRRLGLRCARLPILNTCDQNASKEEAIVIEHLSFAYKKTPVIHDLSLRIGRGEVVALTGPNGAGKTTLAKILSGLLKEKSGRLLVNHRLASRRLRRRLAFFVMQHADSQLFAERALEEVRLSAHVPEQAENLLESYGLSMFKDAHPSTLSGGQKQRLLLAVAESMDHPLLILDEPTSGLDGENMRLLAARLRQLADHGKTILVITHDQEFISLACSRLIRMERGRKVFDEQILG